MLAQDQLRQIKRAVASAEHQRLEQAARWSQREHELTSSLADTENRLRAIKADGAAARSFAESEDIDGKGMSSSSVPADAAFPLMIVQLLSTALVTLWRALMTLRSV